MQSISIFEANEPEVYLRPHSGELKLPGKTILKNLFITSTTILSNMDLLKT
jgi:hypothetical protein